MIEENISRVKTKKREDSMSESGGLARKAHELGGHRKSLGRDGP